MSMQVRQNSKTESSPVRGNHVHIPFNTPVAVFVAVIVTRDESAGLYTPKCDIGNRSDIDKGYLTGYVQYTISNGRRP